MSNLVDKIQAQKIGDVLHMLVDNYERNPDGHFVKANLILNSGNSVAGVVIKIEDVEGYKNIVMCENPMDEKIMNLTFLPMSQVIGLHLSNAQFIAPQLSNGKISRVPGGVSEITNLDCKRKLQIIWDEIKSEGQLNTDFNVDWNTCTDSNELRFNLLDVAKAVKKSILKIVEDDYGAEAFSQIEKFIVSNGADKNMKIHKNGSELQLQLNLEMMLPNKLNEKIEESLNSVLG